MQILIDNFLVVRETYVSNNGSSLRKQTLMVSLLVYQQKTEKTENSIRLTELTLGSSGQYKCEVSTEAPNFATTYRKANLTVIGE